MWLGYMSIYSFLQQRAQTKAKLIREGAEIDEVFSYAVDDVGFGLGKGIVVKVLSLQGLTCYFLMQLRALRPAQLRHYHTEPNQERLSAQSEHPPLGRAPSPLPTPLSRSVPKQMLQDREALYHDVLLLKGHINKLTDENQRLRTKVMMLEGERGKAARFLQEEGSYFRLMKREKTPLRVNEVLSSQVESMVAEGLRQIAEQCRQKLQVSQAENKRLKKTAKYAKIHQLELTCNLYLAENQRLAALLADARRLQEHSFPEQAVEQERKMRRKAEEGAKKVEEQLRAAEAALMQVEERLKKEQEGFARRERKWQNEVALERRKATESQTQCELLRRAMEGRREGSEHAGNPKFNRSLYPRRELPNNPLFKNSIPSTHTRSAQSEENAKLRAQNQALKEQLLHKQISKVEEAEQQDSLHNTKGKRQEEDTVVEQKQPTAQKHLPTIERHSVELDKHTQQLQTPTKKKYKPEKAQLAEIKELLTIRMAAQQFPFEEMRADIEKTGADSFSYADLCEMLVSEPFFLTVEYSRTVLTYLFENPRPSKDSQLPTPTLISKLRKLIGDFTTPANHQATLQRAIQIITQNKAKLRKQLSQTSTLTREQLQAVLSELGMATNERELVVGELSLFSASLRQLDCESLFERFTLE